MPAWQAERDYARAAQTSGQWTAFRATAAEDALKTVDPDALSPKEALEILYDLKRKLP